MNVCRFTASIWYISHLLIIQVEWAKISWLSYRRVCPTLIPRRRFVNGPITLKTKQSEWPRFGVLRKREVPHSYTCHFQTRHHYGFAGSPYRTFFGCGGAVALATQEKKGRPGWTGPEIFSRWKGKLFGHWSFRLPVKKKKNLIIRVFYRGNYNPPPLSSLAYVWLAFCTIGVLSLWQTLGLITGVWLKSNEALIVWPAGEGHKWTGVLLDMLKHIHFNNPRHLTHTHALAASCSHTRTQTHTIQLLHRKSGAAQWGWAHCCFNLLRQLSLSELRALAANSIGFLSWSLGLCGGGGLVGATENKKKQVKEKSPTLSHTLPPPLYYLRSWSEREPGMRRRRRRPRLEEAPAILRSLCSADS